MAADEREAGRSIRQRIRQLRKHRGWTQEELAQKARISYKHLSSIERGDRTASLDVYCRIAIAFGVDWPEVFRRPEPETRLSR